MTAKSLDLPSYTYIVKDLLHVCEIPDDELKDGTIIISCKKSDRPKDTHDRRYNLQQCLSEVSVLTNSVPGDVVLRKRGGGLQQIYDLHPAAQALHFVTVSIWDTWLLRVHEAQ